jgi:hypothetical protein
MEDSLKASSEYAGEYESIMDPGSRVGESERRRRIIALASLDAVDDKMSGADKKKLTDMIMKPKGDMVSRSLESMASGTKEERALYHEYTKRAQQTDMDTKEDVLTQMVGRIVQILQDAVSGTPAEQNGR